MNLWVKMPKKPLKGKIRPVSDKSITQRLILFSLLTEEECIFERISLASDPLTTLEAATKLGLKVRLEADTLFTKGPGFYNLWEPNQPVCCGNSGTLMRFLMGLLAPSRIFAVLTGDESLTERPMERIAKPLRLMGANICQRANGKAPLAIIGSRLKGMDYVLPLASAQLKSALILAALHSEGVSNITENIPSRDHTERILKTMGAKITLSDANIKIQPQEKLHGLQVRVGGDFSAAAFFMGAGLLVEGSEIVLEDVNLNPTRTGLLRVLERMGAKFSIEEQASVEPFGTLIVKSQDLEKTEVSPLEIPSLIDEIPLLAVLAAASKAETIIRGVKELKVKESDRLEGIIKLLSLLGRHSYTDGDNLYISGQEGVFNGGYYDPKKDHRLAMAAAIAALRSPQGIIVKDADCVKVSQPNFYSELTKLGVVTEEA